MNIILFVLVLLMLSGGFSFCCNRFNKIANFIGAAGVIFSSLAGLTSLISFYHNGYPLVFNMPWKVPFGSFSIAVDPLSTLFLIPIFILSGLAALYGVEYLRHYYGKKNIGSVWFLFNTLIASMILVVIARNAILFLLAWELMSVSSFFLVLFEGEKKEAYRAGSVYLIATHIGTLFLLVMFVLLSYSSGSFDFMQWNIPLSGVISSIVFICALVGFGTKAGLMPMHIWLPDAHPAAPSHVSAVMSGVMIKTGIYGLIRVIMFLGVPHIWWGYFLIGVGIVSGFLGVLFALAQHDIKRLLAFSSIENIGIISIGVGLGLLGMSINEPVLMVLGFGGGLLHIVNHAFFKGLLFLGAGVVLQKTGTGEIDVLGGLLKKMPVTGCCFFVGAVTICGLPPLNGFISEFLIYLASFKGILGAPLMGVVSLVVIAFLSLIGALAVACFTKVFGIVFLGEPRSICAQKAHEPGACMKAPMLILAGLCVFMGLGAPFIFDLFQSVIVDVTGVSLSRINPIFFEARNTLIYVVIGVCCFYLVLLLAAGARRILLKKRSIDKALTWDCAYAKPKPRMQYTASSFAQPIVDFFKGVLATKKQEPEVKGYFPDKAALHTQTEDVFSEKIFRPIMKGLHSLAEKLTWIQHGQLQFYILYIMVVLIVLLLWKL